MHKVEAELAAFVRKRYMEQAHINSEGRKEELAGYMFLGALVIALVEYECHPLLPPSLLYNPSHSTCLCFERVFYIFLLSYIGYQQLALLLILLGYSVSSPCFISCLRNCRLIGLIVFRVRKLEVVLVPLYLGLPEKL